MALSLKPRRESEIVREILKALPLLGVTAWRNQSGMIRGSHKGKTWAVRMSAAGVSDIIGFMRSSGRIVCIECKRPGQKPTPHQQAFLARVNEAGGLGLVASSVEDVVKGLGR